MTKKITFNIDDEIYSMLQEAAKQADGTAAALAQSIITNWVRYYQEYP